MGGAHVFLAGILYECPRFTKRPIRAKLVRPWPSFGRLTSWTQTIALGRAGESVSFMRIRLLVTKSHCPFPDDQPQLIAVPFPVSIHRLASEQTVPLQKALPPTYIEKETALLYPYSVNYLTRYSHRGKRQYYITACVL